MHAPRHSQVRLRHRLKTAGPVTTAILGLCAVAACGQPSPRSSSHPSERIVATANGVASSSAPRVKSYRLARPPIGLLQATSDGDLVQVRFRLNRALPRDSEGPIASVLIGKAGADAPPQAFGYRSRYCYAAVIGNDFDEPVLRGAKIGTIVPLTIQVRSGRRSSRIAASLRLRSVHSSLSSLGCGTRSRPR